MYGIQIMYSKAHKALHYPLSLTYEMHEETFQLLRSFGYMLEQQNSDTITDLQCDEDENNLSWEWFLDCLKGALGHIDDLVFIFDRHASIEAEVSKFFPDTTHTICCCHFDENMKKRFHIKDVAAIMDKAARSYTELKYNCHMEELHNLHQNAYDYVNAAGPHKWSRVHCPERRYRVMTTNVAECINSCLKFTRQLPLLTLEEFIRNILQRWFHDRH
ncbi:hypothetical protein Ddye_008737 [Dipteronia dyeriana]|uniref:MULE transposase domain-containing protein n=1 Tax=Dipteronia dyeriana TaxID=168575 RepID=A0AAD9XAC6_9ROSI|nr:hypothetical protein Ddye_008737 [Dipteronia dyeriana]